MFWNRHLLVLPLLAGVVVSACGGGHPETGHEPQAPPTDVQVQAARLESLAQPVEIGGVVRARTTATLVSRVVANVEQVLVRPGDKVRAGQTLIRLDARELAANRARAQASLAAAEQAVAAAMTGRDGARAALALASSTHARVAELRGKNSATPHELDEAVGALRGAESGTTGAEAGILQARAGAEAARAALQAAGVAASYATITAPFDGVVTEKLVEPGNMASPGVPLMTVEDARAFRLEVRVDESRVGQIDASQPVEVVLDTVPTPALGKVSEISRALDPASHAFVVKIDLPPSAQLRSGLFGRARIPGPRQQALTVPGSAVVRRGQLASVFVIGSDKRARLRLVNTGAVSGGRVAITSGLDADELVVVSPPAQLVDGAPVRSTGTSSALPARTGGPGEIRR